MKAKLIAVGTWFAAEPWRVKVLGIAVAIAVALALGLSPVQVALAGNAFSGSGGS